VERIKIGTHEIGEGCPCFIVAEIGINHNGELILAEKMIKAAAKAGANAVKFQNYRTEDFITDRTLTYTYRSQGYKITESQWDMFKRCEPSKDWLGQLKRLCDSLNVIFFSTPTSDECLRDLVEVGVLIIKNGSDFLTHLPLLEYMGKTGIPVIISTGMGDQKDVDDAVAAVKKGGSPVILMHCTSAYPTSPKDVNLRRMISLRERHNVPVGFSDHTEGWCAAVQATTMGACVIEKHFTLDHNLPGPDHWFSSTPDEFDEFVFQIHTAQERLGRPNIVPADIELKSRLEYRLSAVAAQDLNEGNILVREVVWLKRPGTGILPRDLNKYLGRKLLKPVKKGDSLKPEDFGLFE